jgi:hypothetical protein
MRPEKKSDGLPDQLTSMLVCRFRVEWAPYGKETSSPRKSSIGFDQRYRGLRKLDRCQDLIRSSVVKSLFDEKAT